MFNKFKKNKATKISTAPPAPRTMDEINVEYGRLVSQAGQAQYQAYVYSEDLKRINQELKNLNYEAAERKRLDAKADLEKPVAAPQPETTQAGAQ